MQAAGDEANVALLDRIFSRCEPDTNGGCLLWTGALKDTDYPSISANGISGLAGHRLVFELTKGPIPDGQIVLHSCDTRPCLEPNHLHAGSYSRNIQDAYDRGRRPREFTGHYGMGENHHHAKLSDKQVVQIYLDPRASPAVAKDHDCSPRTVRDIKAGRRRATTIEAAVRRGEIKRPEREPGEEG